MSDVDVAIAYTESENWIEEDMLARFAWLRANDPVYWSETDGLWIVTKYEDVEYVSKHQEIFTSQEGVRPEPLKIGLIDEAEPRHANLRTMINRGFTPRMVKKLEETFRELTREVIDDVVKDGHCEFVEDIAVPLPLRIIAAMIGIPSEDYDRFHEWSDAMISGEGSSDPEVLAKAGKAYVEYATYATAILEARREQPRDDLASILVGAKDDGLLKTFDSSQDRIEHRDPDHMELANDELIKLMVILMVAGNETTRNAISGGMEAFIDNPDQCQKLIDDPSLLSSACEEIVRFVSPVRSFTRTVLEDTELKGKRLEAGQKVLMIYLSANRDETVFDDANSFQIERNPTHLGFGIGSHFCLGANLARMELRVAFAEILRRMPNMEYAQGGSVLKPSSLVRSCAELKVRFTPERVLAEAG
ncbi:MAG: cytochrome P450 [Myxococcales bacterium]|nr:cytochrome P450 [Myxococcales bacterium]